MLKALHNPFCGKERNRVVLTVNRIDVEVN